LDYGHFTQQTDRSLEVYLCCTHWLAITYHSPAGPEEPDSSSRRLATNVYARVTFQLHSNIRHCILYPFGILWEDRVDSFLLFLHLLNSVHSKLFCRDRFSLLKAFTLLDSSSCICSARQVLSLSLSTDFLWRKTHSTWEWERRKELWWALMDFPGWMAGGEGEGVHHETHFPTVLTQPVSSLMADRLQLF